MSEATSLVTAKARGLCPDGVALAPRMGASHGRLEDFVCLPEVVGLRCANEAPGREVLDAQGGDDLRSGVAGVEGVGGQRDPRPQLRQGIGVDRLLWRI